MFRTRDFILFILVLFFLGISIVTTVVHDTRTVPTPESIAFHTADFQKGAIATEKSIDRQSIIEQLRIKLANSTQKIEPSASVESPEVIEEVVDADAVVQKCLYPDDSLSMVPRWPLTGVQLAMREGARIVYQEEKSVIPAVSSTTDEKVVMNTQTLLQLPAHAQKQAQVVCVPSEVVGVTNGGILMFNGDVNSYRKIPENTLIGYARDGFPIYGVYTGEVDACGGYDGPGGYRYTISTERDYIVGCYVGTPAKFSL